MSPSGNLLRKSHFLGAKIRTLRKRQGLTLDDLSVRCIQIDPEAAPSVSYLSMIENSKRVPSEKVLRVLCEIFQRDLEWFLDENAVAEPQRRTASAGGLQGMPLEPAFLFSRELLRTALPELLSQTGTTGRQFTQLLIRSHQELHHNRFPDLERAAEEVGRKQFPLRLDQMQRHCRRLGLEIRWFDDPAVRVNDDGHERYKLLRSFYEPPGTVYINRALQAQPQRFNYELATHIGHKILHGGDGQRSSRAAGGFFGGVPQPSADNALGIEHRDILLAWRDFECSFFAGALLCPKTPFRQYLMRTAHALPDEGASVELSPAVALRRMTAVSPYPYWHYFDAYPPGRLRAVYRGNGIPLPWGNMRALEDPCRQWAVFRMLQSRGTRPAAQLSVLRDRQRAYLSACLSVRTRDAAGNPHVICAGVDLSPALEAEQVDAAEVIARISDVCQSGGGAAMVPGRAADVIRRVGKVQNIGWIESGLEAPARIICPRSSACPREPGCTRRATLADEPWAERRRGEIVGRAASPHQGPRVP